MPDQIYGLPRGCTAFEMKLSSRTQDPKQKTFSFAISHSHYKIHLCEATEACHCEHVHVARGEISLSLYDVELL